MNFTAPPEPVRFNWHLTGPRVLLGAVLAVALLGRAKWVAVRRRGIADSRALRPAIREHAPGGLVAGERAAVLSHPVARRPLNFHDTVCRGCSVKLPCKCRAGSTSVTGTFWPLLTSTSLTSLTSGILPAELSPSVSQAVMELAVALENCSEVVCRRCGWPLGLSTVLSGKHPHVRNNQDQNHSHVTSPSCGPPLSPLPSPHFASTSAPTTTTMLRHRSHRLQNCRDRLDQDHSI
jgi:hypothetical protein